MKICVICNKLGKNLFDEVFQYLLANNTIDFYLREDDYPTDLKSSKYSLFRLVKRILKSSYMKRCDINRLNILGTKKYDIVLCLGYYQIHSSFIERVIKNNPSCRKIIYFYDSFCRLNFSNDIKLFDVCYTYDRQDALIYNIHYLPFFATLYNTEETEYDLCHIGSWSPGHLYRVPILNFIQKSALGLKTFFKCTYQNLEKFSLAQKTVFFIKAFTSKEYREYYLFFKKFRNSSLLTTENFDYKDVLDIESKSRCIVEINAYRAGLSPRVINALANGRKVIINNKHIRKEKFYDESSIYIIDEKNPYFEKAFLDKPRFDFDMSDLFVKNWVRILFENGNNKYDIIDSL